MRNTLQAFRRAFERVIDTGSFRAQFLRMKEACPELAAFRTPQDLVAHQLQERLVTHEQKDRVLHALIRVHQKEEPLRHPAEALLFLAMYPALVRVYRGTRHLYDDEADCAAETRFEFMRQVARWKLPKGDRLAANLWMNTRRELLRRNVKSKKEANAIREATTAAGLLVEAAAEDEEEKEAVEVSVGHLWQLEPGGPRPYDPDDLELRRGLAWLMRKGGFSAEDAALVFARYLCRLPWKTIAERLGINAETARKRARELAQIVRDIPDIWESCPGFDDFMCIPQVEGSEGETLH